VRWLQDTSRSCVRGHARQASQTSHWVPYSRVLIKTRFRTGACPYSFLGESALFIASQSLSDADAISRRMDMHECVVDSTTAGLSRKVTAMLELPGMKREAVRLELRNGQLVIEGDRRPPAHAHHSSRRSSTLRSPDNLTGPGVPPPNDSRVEESCRAAVAEMRYGRFRRVLTVPPGVDVSHPYVSSCAAADSFRRPHRSKPVWKTAFLPFPGRSRATVLVSDTISRPTLFHCLHHLSAFLCSALSFGTVYSRFTEHCTTIILSLSSSS
jgi:HSP20 family molecular chaperone IbpA